LIGALELMRLRAEALFTVDAEGRILRVNEPGGAPAPPFFFGRTSEGSVWRFRDDVSSALAGDLAVLVNGSQTLGPEALMPIDPAPFIERISRDRPIQRVGSGPAFVVPIGSDRRSSAVAVTADTASVLSPYLESWLPDLESGVPMAAVLHGGRAVSVCCSVRVTPRAHEAGVETHAEFRRQGHAEGAVTAWAALVRRMGAIPLYSTSWVNHASRAVARKLELDQFGVDLSIT